MVSIIDRYLFREIGLTMLATLVSLLAIALSHRLAGYLSMAAGGLLAKNSIFLLLGLQAVELLTLLMPLAFLLGIMLALGRLYRDHEMTALAACGYGPLQVYRASYLLAVPLAVLVAVVTLFILPTVMEWRYQAVNKARQEAEVSLFIPGTFREVMNGRHVVYIEALDERELRNVFIRTRKADESLSVTTGARGRQETDEQGIRHIVLEQGHHYRGVPGQANYDLLGFARALVRIDNAAPIETWKHRETLPTRNLLGSNEPQQITELQLRLNSPLQILLIALWAPLLARTQPREGRYGRIVAAVLIYTVYFNLVGVGESWLSRGVFGANIGLWWVHGLFLLLGLGLWWYHSLDRPRLRRFGALMRGAQ